MYEAVWASVAGVTRRACRPLRLSRERHWKETLEASCSSGVEELSFSTSWGVMVVASGFDGGEVFVVGSELGSWLIEGSDSEECV